MTDDRDNQAFVEALRARFEAAADGIDAATAARIAQARRHALQGGRRPFRLSPWLPAGAIATACLALLIYVLVDPGRAGGGQATPERVTSPTEVDMELISNLELYEDLDFYEWLEQHELPS
jgi:hypothetical protein